MPHLRRWRGALLRLALRKTMALSVGGACLVPGFLLLAGNYAWESGATDGLALLLVATGMALMWTGLTGRKPDWID